VQRCHLAPIFVAAQCTTLPPFLFRSYSLVRLIFAAVGWTFSLVLILSLQSPQSSVTQEPLSGQTLIGYGPWPALSLTSIHHCTPFNALPHLHMPHFTHCSKINHSSSNNSSLCQSHTYPSIMSSNKDSSSISSISPLTSTNYHLWADDIKS
jgi:hypothetical protein